MKKILFTLILGLMISNLSFAQNNQQDLTQELEQMSIEMNKAMEQMQKLLGNSQFLVDTLLLKGLEPLAGAQNPLLNMPTDSLDMNGMIDLMQEQMSQLSKQDWSEIEKLMQQFSQMLPIPEGQQGTKKMRNEKGKKIHSM